MEIVSLPLQMFTTDTSLSSKALLEGLRSQNVQILLACLAGLGGLSLLDARQQKGILATGQWAKTAQKNKARRKAKKQMRTRKHNEVALSIGPPGGPGLHLSDMQRGTVVIGAPGGGKTFSAIDPMTVSAIQQGFPIILYDYKYPTQAARLAPIASSRGYDVQAFAPGFEESAVCNLLDLMRDEKDATMARQAAKVLSTNIQQGNGVQRDDPFFQGSGENLLTAVLMTAKGSPYPDMVTAHAILSLSNLAERLQRPNDVPFWAKVNFDQFAALAGSEKTAASVVGTATQLTTRLLAPDLLASLVGETTLPLDLTGRQMIVLGMDRERHDSLAPIVATVLHMLIVRNMSKKRRSPLMVSGDEIATVYLPGLVRMLNENRENGLVMIAGFQNLAQLEKTYSRPVAQAIFGACATKFLFNPGEPESAQTFSRYLGDEEIRYTETSRSRGGGKTTINRSKQRRTRNLFEPSRFLKLPTGKVVILNPGFTTREGEPLPLHTKIRVPRSTIRLIQASEAAWPRLQDLLNKNRSPHPLTQADFQQRIDYAETILPPVPPDSDGIL